MTGMEHAIEQAARIMHGCTGDEDGAPVAARALADAGLLAPAPLTEEWMLLHSSGPSSGTIPMREAKARGMARDGESLRRRYVTDWEVVSRAEGDGMNRQNTVVLARDVEAAEAVGYPRHRWCVVTPRNIKIGPRGMQARYAVAVDLTEDELTEMLVHDSVAPAFLWAGDAEVVRVTAEGDGRAEQ